MDIQSGFVIAVIVAAVLLVDRLGGSDELVRRFFQVALGVVLAATVVSATTAFIQPPDDQSAQDVFNSEDGENTEDVFDRLSIARTIQIVAGIVILVLAIARRPFTPTLAVGGVLGGVLLLLASGSPGTNGDYLSLFVSIGNEGASQEADLLNLGVLAAATITLLTFGYMQFERPSALAPGATDDTEY